MTQAVLLLHCRGIVQGVGFRPAVHRLASQLGLAGTLRNVSGGVALRLLGPRPQLEQLLRLLPSSLPPAARLEPLQPQWLPLDPSGTARPGLHIEVEPPRLLGEGLVAAALAPDRAPCAACLAELADPGNRRHRYPFISCNVCGPRYTIATAEPFARAHTSLAAFPLCPSCRQEFADPRDRRFHAETISCPHCGPRLRWLDARGGPADGADAHSGEPLAAALALLRRGGILALMGVGGFQLLVDAGSAAAVARLRQRKRRPHKPFALLIDAPGQLADLLHPSAAELAALLDPAAPIVLLPCPEAIHGRLLPGVAPAAPGLGVMLPASPLHLLLAQAFGRPLVATSGNRAGEPLCISAAEALERLSDIADGFLLHDRAIARPLDDSVLQIIDGQPALLRRARGYAPASLPLAEGVPGTAQLALGGDLKNAPALAIGDRLWLAPQLGDLMQAQVQRRWRRGVAELLRHHATTLTAVAVDRHPGYASHQQAASLLMALRPAAGRAPPSLRRVGHHRAHGLAVAAEHDLALPLPALTLDGLGYGEGDGALWGCELLWLEPGRARRLASLRPFPLPGGERAVREPRRSALGLLLEAGLIDHPGAAAVRRAFAPSERRLLQQAVACGCNAPRCSSAGRLFDAVAALLGLVMLASHEAQAGLALQAAAATAPTDAGAYPLPLRPGLAGADAAAGADHGQSLPLLDWQPLLEALLQDGARGREPALMAARFHQGLVQGLAIAVATLLPPTTVAAPQALALAGGCMQNRLLLEGLIAALRQRGLRPFWSQRLPANDGGLAVGQLLALRGARAAQPG